MEASIDVCAVVAASRNVWIHLTQILVSTLRQIESCNCWFYVEINSNYCFKMFGFNHITLVLMMKIQWYIRNVKHRSPFFRAQQKANFLYLLLFSRHLASESKPIALREWVQWLVFIIDKWIQNTVALRWFLIERKILRRNNLTHVECKNHNDRRGNSRYWTFFSTFHAAGQSFCMIKTWI